MGQLVNDVQRTFEDQTTMFKLNLSFGFVLFNNDTEQMQYHHSSANNNRVFDAPFLMRNREDLDQVRATLENLDVFELARQRRPNSKWVVMDITNATFYVTKLRDHPIGRSRRLPKYVLENPAIVSLDCNGQTGLPYEDNLCLFRCLALHRRCHPHNLERDTQHYFERYSEDDDFDGVTLEESPELEKMFELNIHRETEHLQNTAKLTWEAEHIPLSVSVHSNVSGYNRPKCFVSSGCASDMIKEFVDYLVKISQKSYALLLDRFSDVFEQINE
ncbi:Hypothetical predicted protein [Paramuricea clavata]|uniref:Uncharacterized protein n=1 Tax=Paramuricea clavata TaxID=317549 RepID=A0A6S7GQT4_PARCT|nr:Hypothetical predicted protein [Paramuricea clavata]